MFQIHYRPKYLPNDRVEQDPSDWKDGLFTITADAVKWTKEEGYEIAGFQSHHNVHRLSLSPKMGSRCMTQLCGKINERSIFVRN
ncbi:hypothetical protein ACI2OX_01840 [Bacillus sp. N9]